MRKSKYRELEGEYETLLADHQRLIKDYKEIRALGVQHRSSERERGAELFIARDAIAQAQKALNVALPPSVEHKVKVGGGE